MTPAPTAAMWRLTAAARDGDGQPPAKTGRHQAEGSAGARDRKRAAGEAVASSPPPAPSSGLNRMVISLQKLSLQTSQQMGSLAGAQYRTCLVPTGVPPVAAATAAGVLYSSSVVGNRNHNLGPPQLHTAMSFLESLLDQPEFGAKDILTPTLSQLNAAPQAEVSHLLLFFRARDARPPRTDSSQATVSSSAAPMEVVAAEGGAAAVAAGAARVVLNVQLGVSHRFRGPDLDPVVLMGRLYESIHSYMLAVGGVPALGAAPPGQAERGVQRELQSLQRR